VCACPWPSTFGSLLKNNANANPSPPSASPVTVNLISSACVRTSRESVAAPVGTAPVPPGVLEMSTTELETPFQMYLTIVATGTFALNSLPHTGMTQTVKCAPS
jgi:hypothetical protein